MTQAIITVPPRGQTAVERAFESPALAPLFSPPARALIEPIARKVGATFELIMAETFWAVQKNPQLAECTPASLLTAVMRAASWGLQIGEKAHLVPFDVKVPGTESDYMKQAQAIRDWKGDIDVMVHSGAARKVNPQVVYQNEVPSFEYIQGSNPDAFHRPIWDSSKRGPIALAYVVAHTSQTQRHVRVMDRAEIDAIRKGYSKKWVTKWVDNRKVEISLDEIPWFAKKTVVHQIVKELPTSIAQQRLVAEFDEEDSIVPVDSAAEEALRHVQSAPAQPQLQAPPPNLELSGAATEAQIAKLRGMADSKWLTRTEKSRIRKRLETPSEISASVAAEIIEECELRIDDRQTIDKEKSNV